MIKELNCSCICREDIIVAVVDQVKEPKTLEVAIVVIITLLVVFALIFGFNKLKGEPEEPEEGHTYY